MKIVFALFFLVGTVVHADAVVNGNKNGATIYLFGEAAQRLYTNIGQAGATLEEFDSCVELRTQNIVCGFRSFDFEYQCTLQVNDSGNVTDSTAFVCARPT